MSRKLQRVVRCLSRNGNVVWVRLAESRRSNTHELRFSAELLDAGTANVPHSAAQSADHLEQHIAHRSLIGNAPLDSLGNQLLSRHLSFLEVSVGAAVLHGGEAAHASDHLEATPLEQERFA